MLYDYLLRLQVAIAFQKAVIEKEKELIGIILPEEDRLSGIEEEAKALIIREERLEKLPIRKERLAQVESYPDDELLLTMDSMAFESFYNKKVAEHNESIRLEALKVQQEAQDKIDNERKVIEKEKAELAHQKEIK